MADQPPTEAEVAEIRSRFQRRVLLLDEFDLFIDDWKRLRVEELAAETTIAELLGRVSKQDALRSLAGELVWVLKRALYQLGYRQDHLGNWYMADPMKTQLDSGDRFIAALARAAEMGLE